MTPQEKQLIADLARKLTQTPVGTKDAEADAFIRQTIGTQPDALYQLVQTVLVQTLALDRAQAQIQELERRQGGAVPSGGSFLGGALGTPLPAPSGWQLAPMPPSAGPFGFGGVPGGGVSNFLRGAATTAAGVAAGALAFEGIESLLHHGFGGNDAGRETIINNYYDQEPTSSGGERSFLGPTGWDTANDSGGDADVVDTSYTPDDSDDVSDDSSLI